MSCRIVRFIVATLAAVLVFTVTVFTNTATSSAAEPNTLTGAELDAGWILLFDGESLFGWRASSDVDWSVQDGAIHASEGEKGLLCTTAQWGNFELKLQFRSALGTNSGVFLRTPPKLVDDHHRFYEVNIADQDSSDFPTGSIVGRAKGAAVSDSEDWQTMDITADGGRITVKIDGRRTIDYNDPRPLGRGYIGLQFNQGAVAFRDIKLRPLRIEPIFNGRNLDGWHMIERFRGGKPTKMEVEVTEDGAMRVTNGPGAIETDEQWEDFVMQLQIFSAGEELNSGVFFRTIPGEDWAGYESQIHNGTVGDTDQPNNCGTGGIWKRQDARRIVAEDYEWFHKTINMVDRHIAVWVEGIQVSDFTDRREPAENPRQGYRAAAGTIQFQGHDPTTDLRFRAIEIGEVPSR